MHGTGAGEGGTCQVRVVGGVDKVVRQREAHVFRLVQFVRRDDAVLVA